MVECLRTELVWPGKYDANGQLARIAPVSLPFERTELHPANDRRDDEPPGECGAGEDDAEWRNRLICGDNLLAMGSLLGELRGKVDLVYIDPPFGTGADFEATQHVGEGDVVHSRESARAYRDTWGSDPGAYLSAISQRLWLIRELLSERGTVFVHVDWHVGHLVRCVLDEIFGRDAFRNEIVWRYRRWPAKTRVFQRMHDVLFWYGRGATAEHTFHRLYEPLAASTQKTWGTKRQVADFSTGRRKPSQTDEETPGAPMSDVWDIGIIAPIAKERVGYPTQKPEALLERVILAASKPGDLVADFFCGSGTTLAVAERHGRRWLGCDLGRFAVNTSRKRLLDQPRRRPFEVWTLGAAERRWWASSMFSGASGVARDAPNDPAEADRALRGRILSSYGAAPVNDDPALHGSKDGAVVWVAGIAGDVSPKDIEAAAHSARARGAAALDVLAWDWSHGMPALHVGGVALRRVLIPREITDEVQDARARIDFFDVPTLLLEVTRQAPSAAIVSLRGFDIAARPTSPTRPRVASWADYIDAWSVDFDHQAGMLVSRFHAHRTRQRRKLPLETPPFHYPGPGRYRILVQVVDIFGQVTRCETEHVIHDASAARTSFGSPASSTR